MSALGAAQIAVAAVLGGSIAAVWIAIARNRVRHERAVLKEHARAIRAHYAAVEAAEDNPSYSPDAVEQLVSGIVSLADGLWRTGELGALDGSPFGPLVRAWARSRQTWLGTGLRVVGRPSVDLLGVVNRGIEAEDRVIVRVRIRIHCKHPKIGLIALRFIRLDERWTFERRDSQWMLRSMDGDPLAGPVLSAPLIPSPSSDTDRLREESLAELAKKQNVGDDSVLAGLVGADEPPAYALPDLSIVDGRFEPALIAAELARLLEAWEQATSGSQASLDGLASERARATLLGPGTRSRLVVRDAVLKSWEAKALLLSRRPPAIELALTVEAVRYAVSDDGTYWGGSEPHRMDLSWTLELTDSAKTPWRLAISSNSAEAVPGGT